MNNKPPLPILIIMRIVVGVMTAILMAIIGSLLVCLAPIALIAVPIYLFAKQDKTQNDKKKKKNVLDQLENMSRDMMGSVDPDWDLWKKNHIDQYYPRNDND